MGGTREGGLAAAAKNKQKYGADFYNTIGAKGGRKGHTGGFGAGEEGRARARIYGAMGGRVTKAGRADTEERRKQRHAQVEKNRIARLERIRIANMRAKIQRIRDRERELTTRLKRLEDTRTELEHEVMTANKALILGTRS